MSGAPGPDFDYGGGRDGGGGRGGGGYGEGFRGRGGYGGGGRDRRPGGRGGGGGQRDGDWPCPNASCGNVNFAKRMECYKCGTTKPGGFSQSGNGSFRSGSNYGANQGGGYGRGSAYPGSGQNDGGGGPPNNYDDAPAGSSYGGSRYAEAASGGSYGSTRGPAGRGFDTHGVEKGRGYGGSDYGRGEKGLDYGGADYGRGDKGPGYVAADYSRGDKVPGYVAADYGRGDKAPGYGGGDYGRGDTRPVNHYSGSDPSFVKQCDDHCGDTCDNSRIYVSGLPLDVTSDELRDLFGGIGQVARIKQKRGYKDQWPWNIKIYTDEAGNNKGDAVLSYEDPSAAHSAGGFFNDYSLRGHRIKVSMAEKYAPRPQDQRPGGDRGYGGGGGPDRRYGGGGYRSRPY